MKPFGYASNPEEIFINKLGLFATPACRSGTLAPVQGSLSSDWGRFVGGSGLKPL